MGITGSPAGRWKQIRTRQATAVIVFATSTTLLLWTIQLRSGAFSENFLLPFVLILAPGMVWAGLLKFRVSVVLPEEGSVEDIPYNQRMRTALGALATMSALSLLFSLVLWRTGVDEAPLTLLLIPVPLFFLILLAFLTHLHVTDARIVLNSVGIAAAAKRVAARDRTFNRWVAYPFGALVAITVAYQGVVSLSKFELSSHPYLATYFIGCGLAAFLTLASFPVAHAAAWLTKTNVIVKNLRKVDPPEKATLLFSAAMYFGAFCLNVALSWIAVAIVLLWQLPVGLLRFLRELFSSTPEAIKLLRFPLRNNPEMSPEAVWAHLFALAVANGANTPTVASLLRDLDQVKGKVRTFSPDLALDQLSPLKAVDPETISGARNLFARADEMAAAGDFENLFPARITGEH